LNVGVGIGVLVMSSGTNGSGVTVAITGEGVRVGRIPPGAVGVAYCPHREAFPTQDASKKEAAIKKLISRFTKGVRW
jgi:hypothetical protein